MRARWIRLAVAASLLGGAATAAGVSLTPAHATTPCWTLDAGVTKQGGGTVVTTPPAWASCMVPTPGWGVIAQPTSGDQEGWPPPGYPNGFYVNATITVP
jgi:hypothetical protein